MTANRCEMECELTKRKCQFDRDEHGDWFSEPRAGHEAPLLGGFDGFLIQSERRVQRANNLNLAHGSVRKDDTLEQDRSLDLCPHRIGRVLRLHFAKRLGQEHAIARAIRTSSGPATKPFTDT